MDPLIARLTGLTQAQTEFVRVVDQLEPAQRDRPGVCGEWSVQQVVAHLIGWDELFVEFIVRPETFTPPQDVDQFNQRSVENRSGDRWDQLMREMTATFDALRRVAAGVSEEVKIYDRVIEWLDGRTEDYCLHRAQIAAWLDH